MMKHLFTLSLGILVTRAADLGRDLQVEGYVNAASSCSLSTTRETCLQTQYVGLCCAKLTKGTVLQTANHLCVPADMHMVTFSISNVNYRFECNFAPSVPTRAVCTTDDTPCTGG